jgi:hypothetical protein
MGEIFQYAETLSTNIDAMLAKVPAGLGRRKRQAGGGGGGGGGGGDAGGEVVEAPAATTTTTTTSGPPAFGGWGPEGNPQLCGDISSLHDDLQNMRDGSVFSPAKMLFNKESRSNRLVEMARALQDASASAVEGCFTNVNRDNMELALFLPTIRSQAQDLSEWVKVKKYEDGFAISTSTDCEVADKASECGCECDKANKVENNNFFTETLLLCLAKDSQDVQNSRPPG